MRSSFRSSACPFVRACSCVRSRSFVRPFVCTSADGPVRSGGPLRTCGRVGGLVRPYVCMCERIRPRSSAPCPSAFVRVLRPRPHHAPVRTPLCVHVCGRAYYTRALCAKRSPEHLGRIRSSAAPGAAPGDPGPLQAACRSRREAKSCVKRLLKKFYKMY